MASITYQKMRKVYDDGTEVGGNLVYTPGNVGADKAQAL